MGFTSEYGLKLRLKNVPGANRIPRNDVLLFSESNSRFLVEVSEKQLDRFEYITRAVPHAAIGEVTENRNLSINGLDNGNLVNLDLDELLDPRKMV